MLLEHVSEAISTRWRHAPGIPDVAIGWNCISAGARPSWFADVKDFNVKRLDAFGANAEFKGASEPSRGASRTSGQERARQTRDSHEQTSPRLRIGSQAFSATKSGVMASERPG